MLALTILELMHKWWFANWGCSWFLTQFSLLQAVPPVVAKYYAPSCESTDCKEHRPFAGQQILITHVAAWNCEKVQMLK